jgi:hypothetical protein
LLPDRPYTDVSCNGGTFTTNTLGVQRVKIFVKQGSNVPTAWDSKPNSDEQRLFPQWDYDFSNQDWANSSYNYNYNNNYNYNYNNNTTYYNGYSSNYDIRNFSISPSITNPAMGDRVKFTFNALDSNGNTLSNYYGSNANINVQYRTSTSSSWINTTNSSFYSIDNDSPYFSNGSAYTYITFNRNYDYRITITDNSTDIYTQQVIYVNGYSYNYNNNSSYYGNISSYALSLSNSSPSIYNQVKLTLNALDSNGNTINNYNGYNSTISIAYRTSSSYAWNTTTNSSYYSIDTNTPYFSNGSASTNITFNKNYDYRITVTDNNSNISTQKIVYLNGSSSSTYYYNNTNNFYITSDNTYPNTNEQVDLSVKARDNSNTTVTNYM